MNPSESAHGPRFHCRRLNSAYLQLELIQLDLLGASGIEFATAIFAPSPSRSGPLDFLQVSMRPAFAAMTRREAFDAYQGLSHSSLDPRGVRYRNPNLARCGRCPACRQA